MKRPWFQMHSRDWLDNKELRRCSPTARAVLVDLMCLANEGTPYGHLADDSGPLTDEFMASRCIVRPRQFKQAVAELKTHKRLEVDESGLLFVPRMVRDERIRLARANGGPASIGHPSTHPSKSKEGYPSTHPSLENISRAGAPAESVCVSGSSGLEVVNRNQNRVARDGPVLSADFPPWWDRWCHLTGRKVGRSNALTAWIGVVSPEQAPLAMLCLERYGLSDEVSRGVVSNPDKWIYEQARDDFTADWPPARASPTGIQNSQQRLLERAKEMGI